MPIIMKQISCVHTWQNINDLKRACSRFGEYKDKVSKMYAKACKARIPLYFVNTYMSSAETMFYLQTI